MLDAPSRKQGDLTVHLFSTDERRWFMGSPFIYFYRPVEDFFIDNVPPGDYYIVAVTRETDEALAGRRDVHQDAPDAAVAAQWKAMASVAQRITVPPRRPVAIDLPVTPLPAP